MSAPRQRKIAIAKRPTVPLTGAENVALVDNNRVFHYGYQYFLAADKIRAIFGERIARSKKIRKAELRDILKNAMLTIKKDDQMTINDFMNLTEQKITLCVAKLQAMPSSPQEMEVIIPAAAGKRKKVTSPQALPAAAAAAAADVAGPYRPPQVVIPAAAAPAVADNTSPDKSNESKKKKVDPIANQMNFITDLMHRTTQSSILQRTGTLPGERGEVYVDRYTTERSIRAGLAAAQKRDEENVARQRIIEEEARRTEALRYMRNGMKDITDMFGKSKM
jgi:hypothetical protein